MLKYLLSFLLITFTIFAEDNESYYYEDDDDTNVTIVEDIKESDLYLTYETLPKTIYQNQIFTVKTKILNTNKEYSELITSYGSFFGLNILSLTPTREQDEFTSYDTYYFQAKETQFKTPTLNYKLNRNEDVEPISLEGKNFYAVQLNSDEDFTNVLADNFTIESYKTTQYDQDHNIIVFTASTSFANVADFNLSFATMQGFESMSTTLPEGRMTYYAVIPKHLRMLRFSYFNLQTSSYTPVEIPVEVDDDSVSTQMDLAPTQYTHTLAKIIIAVVLITIGIIAFIITRQKRYFFVIALTPIIYVSWVYYPKEKLCIERNAKIYLLPMKNSTIFYKYSSDQKLQKMGEVEEYNKVLLPNLNIGWVKNEDLCEN
jgi:hypothetical protein